MCVFDIGPI